MQTLVTKRKWAENEWGIEQDEAFRKLKEILRTAPAIWEPDFDK